uniref:Bowman-Birk serine protease inhibitors family domain-containing protein n=1 Tax=Coptis japonica TaxID=3442 RepID=A0A8V3_COPJA|nr:hypothetical protein [Coptis japonica]
MPFTENQSKGLTEIYIVVALEVAARGSNTSCCNQCLCTKSIPPQCRCTDVKEYCHSSCTNCLCTRSIPPQCRCTDVKLDNCAPPSCRKMDIEQVRILS